MRHSIATALVLAAALLTPAAADAYGLAPRDVAVSPDGRNVYATGNATLTFARDTGTGALTRSDDLGPNGDGIAISPDGRFVFLVRGGNYPGHGWSNPNALDVLSRDPDSGRLTLQWRVAEGDYGTVVDPRDVAVSPDGRHLYLSQAGAKALVTFAIDQDTGRPALEQTLWRTDIGALCDIVVAPDGKHVYTTNTRDSGVVSAFKRDPATGRLAAVASYPDGVDGSSMYDGAPLSISPDGSRLYVGADDYGIWQRDSATGELTMLSHANLGSATYNNWQFGDSVLGTSPEGDTVFSARGGPDWNYSVMHQSKVTSDGVALERSYAESKDLHGLVLPRTLAWSPDGRHAYLVGGRHVPGYPYGASDGIAVLRWDAASRKLSQHGFLEEKLKDDRTGSGTSVSIDDGALFTNDPDVRLTIKVPPSGESLRLAGDPSGFDEGLARRIDPDGIYRWRLDTAGAAPRDVRHVYVRVWSHWSNDPVVVSDDIVLDQTAPQVTSARLKEGELKLRAHDNRSGVKRMQVTRDRSKPGKRHHFAKEIGLPDGSGKVYVRVFDGAHNRSRWRTAKSG